MATRDTGGQSQSEKGRSGEEVEDVRRAFDSVEHAERHQWRQQPEHFGLLAAEPERHQRIGSFRHQDGERHQRHGTDRGGFAGDRPDRLDALRDRVAAREGDIEVQVRIGIATGPVVAGVIGEKKLYYDLWGMPVTIASRMQAHGLPGEIQVTRAVKELLEGRYRFKERGGIDVKGVGEMQTWLLTDRVAEPG